MKTNLTMAEEKEADMALASLADSARRFVELLERIEKYIIAQERERNGYVSGHVVGGGAEMRL